ncbi:MAG: signal peptide peptidase SppA [Phycisphaerales bacterium]
MQNKQEALVRLGGGAVAVFAAVMLAAGCQPVTVSMTLFDNPGRLGETEVERDAGARGDKVAVIDIRGVIADREDGLIPGLGGGPGSIDSLVTRLKMAEGDRAVKAVVLQINSPGGTVTASDAMYRELRSFRQRTGKPIVASLGEVAASGGYYVALAADEIVAEPTGITGSIGVIMTTINLSQGLSRVGVVSRSVKSGANKDMANPLEPMREGQYEVLQAMVDEFYAGFRGLVLSRRTIEPGRVDELTDGRVVTGLAAARAGLVDRVGGVRDAFERAKTLAGIGPARMVKYTPESLARPQSVYAATPTQPARAEERGMSLVRLDEITGGLTPGRAYYMWGGE